jgi:hypothetical protein
MSQIRFYLAAGPRAEPYGSSSSSTFGLYFTIPRLGRRDQCANERAGRGGHFIDGPVKSGSVRSRRTTEPAEFPHKLK